MLGTDAEVIASLTELCTRFPVDPLLLRPQWPSMSADETIAAIERLGKEVVPAIRALPTPAAGGPAGAVGRLSTVHPHVRTSRGGVMARFEGKVALVTGGARGQGRSHAVRLAARGRRRGRRRRRPAVRLRAVRDVHPGGPRRDREDGPRLRPGVPRDHRRRPRRGAGRRPPVAQAEERFGHDRPGLRQRRDPAVDRAARPARERWHDTIATNLSGVFFTLQAVSRAWSSAGTGGAIVLTGSTSELPRRGRSSSTCSTPATRPTGRPSPASCR